MIRARRVCVAELLDGRSPITRVSSMELDNKTRSALEMNTQLDRWIKKGDGLLTNRYTAIFNKQYPGESTPISAKSHAVDGVAFCLCQASLCVRSAV